VKGNVIDPLDLVRGATFTEIAKQTIGFSEADALARFKKSYPSAVAMGNGFPAFGADAVRFTLATYPPSNKRIALAPKRIEGNRHFLNKIWNATRLALDLLEGFSWPADASRPDGAAALPAPRTLYDRWIRSRFAAACAAAHDGLDGFRIDEAAHAAYRFFWNDLCDWYLELVKPVLRKRQGTDGGTGGALAYANADVVPETQATLAYVLEGSLRLMHPLMPFITEELWQRVPRPGSRKASVAFGPYPTKDLERAALDPDADAWMDLFKAVVSAVRTIRSEHDLDKKAEIPLRVRSGSPEVLAFLREHEESLRFLIRSAPPVFEAPGAGREPGTTVSVVPSARGPIEVLVPLKGLVTAEEENARIDRGLKKIAKDLAFLDKKLGSPGFVDRAPREVVDEARAQRDALLDAKGRLEAARGLIAEL
jgi:valyl-tRNA synthetase